MVTMRKVRVTMTMLACGGLIAGKHRIPTERKTMTDPCDPLCPFLGCGACPIKQHPRPATVRALSMEGGMACGFSSPESLSVSP